MQKVVVDKTENINEEPIDDDNYNEIVRLVAQEEEDQAILSVIKLPLNMQKRGLPRGLANTIIGLTRKKPKLQR